jgi:hypothetical protein
MGPDSKRHLTKPIDRTPGKRRRRYALVSVAGAGHGPRSAPNAEIEQPHAHLDAVRYG